MGIRRLVILAMVVLVGASAWANGEQEALEVTEVADGFKRIDAGGVQFDWKVDGDQLEVVLSADTTGWVAVGFEPSRMMRDANILIGYVAGGEVTVEDHFGNNLTAHRPDVDLGGSRDLIVIGGSESDGRTEIHFSIPLDSGDDYDQPLTAGSEHNLIYAYGADGEDNTRRKHQERGSFTITL